MSNTYPDRINDINYSQQRQVPSYSSEFPHDLPYDPGATSSLFELNYIPQKSMSFLILILVCILVIAVTAKKRIHWNVLLSSALSFLLALTFFGPLRLPSVLQFNTSLGFVKFGGIVLLIFACIEMVRRKTIDILLSKSFFPISFYLLSMLLSVFVATNLSYFMEDFGIILAGLLFYFISFRFFSWKESSRLLSIFAYILIIASGLVAFIFLFKNTGVLLISYMYPKYENIVFLHDLDRSRIFSIIDFEYFVPCVVFIFLQYIRNKDKKLLYLSFFVFVLSFIAILLVDYRYRFLTYGLGLFLMWLYTKRYRTAILKTFGSLFIALFIAYIGISTFFFKSTIIDRFLLKNYYEDKISVERRLVMYKQALDLFTRAPILGVGLGNYKDNVQIVYSLFGGRTYEPYYKVLQNVYAYPHNWYLTVLAENGIVGFLVLLYLLLTFVEIDIRLWRNLKGNEQILFSTLSSISWLYIFANFFTMMHNSLPMVIIFWSMRGMIERIHYDTCHTNAFCFTNKRHTIASIPHPDNSA